MSIKDLFGKKSGKILPITDLEKVAEDVESVDALESLKIQKHQFIPSVDFSTPANFAKFGSATKYYSDSIKLIYKTYPYDGSRNEKTQWNISSSLLTNYVFDNIYPRNTGYINLGLDYGNTLSTIDSYTLTDHLEYITIKGGPNTFDNTESAKKLFGKSNYYDESLKRTTNLLLDANNGVTVEFYFKKQDNTGSPIQTIFDLWNNQSVTASSYGRFKIEIHPGISGEDDKFYVSLLSGTSGAADIELQSNAILDGNWHHYAIVSVNSDSGTLFQLFQDGNIVSQTVTGTITNLVTGAMIANIGSLVTENYAGGPSLGYGKLSGSLDEFRYWKIARTDKEIQRFYFTEVYGGTNTDDANTDLGVYFKFNEGIFDEDNINSIDTNIIDYSGRISNGKWTGYSLGARSVDSALIQSGFTQEEPADPILYPNHPSIMQLIQQSELVTKNYDQLNNASIYNSFASWILEEDEENGQGLLQLTQIMSEFFDQLYYYIDSLNKLKDHTYRDINPLPFAKKLIESQGLESMELFADSTILETFLSRNEIDVFEDKIYNVKNTIYQNIYNNLLYIYKSKGTEKSIRNLLRCFGVDTELVKLNLYADDQKFIFEDRYEYTSQKRKFLDLNNPDRFQGSVYQITQSTIPNSISYIETVPGAKFLGNTFETEIVFPSKGFEGKQNVFSTPFLTSSLFGIHEVDSINQLTWNSPDRASIQVFAVRPEIESTTTQFVLSSSHFGIEIKTPFFKDTYAEQKWLLSFRIKHENYPLAGKVPGTENGNYVLELHGLNTTMDIINDQFLISASVDQTKAEQYFDAIKSIYLGAHRENFTGDVVLGSDNIRQYSDVQFGFARFWANYLPDSVLEMHAKDITSHGPESYSQNIESFGINGIGTNDVPQGKTLVLYWNFDLSEKTDNGSGSPVLNVIDAGFNILDNSSGTLDPNTYPLLSQMIYNLHPARADFFLRNRDDMLVYKHLPNARRRLPEILNNDDLVNILERDDEVYTRDTFPVNNYFAVEKSMYQNISEEMLRWIGTITQFNNLIGNPANRYEQNYRDLQFLRRLFFENVGNTPDFEKFVDFYKWIDESVGKLVMELVPGTLNTTTVTSDVVESHILERNKYRHKLPTLEFKKKDPIVAVRAINELKYNWKFGHAPIPLKENINCIWWKQRSEKDTEDRQKIFDILSSSYDRKLTTVYDLVVEPIVILDKRPKPYDIVIEETKFNSGGSIEIDISKIFNTPICEDLLLDICGDNSGSGGGPEICSYIEETILKLNPSSNNNFLGSSISANDNGDVVAVGVPNYDYTYTNRGGIAIFKSSSLGGWYQDGLPLTSSGDTGNPTDDFLGLSVSINSTGNVVAAGSEFAKYVIIFKSSSLGGWYQDGIPLTSSGPVNPYDPATGFGNSVSINNDGTIVAIGSKYYWDGYETVGAVYIFKSSSLGGWYQDGAALTSSGDSIADAENFGFSTAINSTGNVVAAGSIYSDDPSSAAGSVVVFKSSSLSGWYQDGTPLTSSGDGNPTYDALGWSVSINNDGNIIAAGSVYSDIPSSSAGSVIVFKSSSLGGWYQDGSPLTLSTGKDYDYLGYSVSISGDGKVIAASSPYYDVPGDSDAGAIFIFKSSSLDGWYLDGTPLSSSGDGIPYTDNFSPAISINNNGKIIVAGSPYFNDPKTFAGAVSIFKLECI